MNTKSNVVVRFIHRLAAIVALSSFALVAPAAETETHNPYTVRGFQVRTNLLPQQSTSAYSSLAVSNAVGPTLFQEMAPCRFVSTLDLDQYPMQWGGLPFQVSESRVYQPIGYLVDGDFTNPCSQMIPPSAVALAIRLGSYKSEGNGSVYVGPSQQAFAHPALVFKQGNDTVQEATVVLHDNAFVVTIADQPTELTIDLLGYFIKDDSSKGDRGEQGVQGERGEKGERGADGAAGAQGERGLQGERGEKGERGEAGVAGAQGEKGDKGDRGENGVAGAHGEKGEKGDKGDRGENGVAGAQGEKGEKGEKGDKGDRGENGVDGAQGEKGEKGDRGENGVAGAQGEKGEKGDKGDRGENGVAGAQGEKGEKGDKGDRGENGAAGAQGEKGEKGDKGDRGEQGLQGERGVQGERGERGHTGPQGLPGVIMSVGEAMFPPGGSINISDGAIRANSVILLTYIEISNGNALGVASQRVGSFVATGSPNKPFKYIILTAN